MSLLTCSGNIQGILLSTKVAISKVDACRTPESSCSDPLGCGKEKSQNLYSYFILVFQIFYFNVCLFVCLAVQHGMQDRSVSQGPAHPP